MTFGSTRAVIKAEKALQENFCIKVIPVPRTISSECGMAIVYNPEDKEKIMKKLEEAYLREVYFYDVED
ncbi:MAG TPA: DUF3343 domain-containing protein [Chitinispirillaceae bacterium]|nr:DUF3343 domain-containing protein [Chitinispirillaceae bacterium]